MVHDQLHKVMNSVINDDSSNDSSSVAMGTLALPSKASNRCWVSLTQQLDESLTTLHLDHFFSSCVSGDPDRCPEVSCLCVHVCRCEYR